MRPVIRHHSNLDLRVARRRSNSGARPIQVHENRLGQEVEILRERRCDRYFEVSRIRVDDIVAVRFEEGRDLALTILRDLSGEGIVEGREESVRVDKCFGRIIVEGEVVAKVSRTVSKVARAK